MKQSVTLFKALADKNRIRILKMLEKKSLCVCEITAILGLAVSTTSKHLSFERGQTHLRTKRGEMGKLSFK